MVMIKEVIFTLEAVIGWASLHLVLPFHKHHQKEQSQRGSDELVEHCSYRSLGVPLYAQQWQEAFETLSSVI